MMQVRVYNIISIQESHLYTMIYKLYVKILKLKKKVGIAVKSMETSRPFEPVRNTYHIAGFVCKILIWVNYSNCCKLIDFNFKVVLIPSFQLSDCSAHVTILCPAIYLIYISLQVLQRVYISDGFAAAGCLPKRPFSSSYIAAIVQHLKVYQTYF